MSSVTGRDSQAFPGKLLPGRLRGFFLFFLVEIFLGGRQGKKITDPKVSL